MSKFIRNLVFYLLIVIVGVWIYDYYNASSTPKNEMSYSNFVKEVQQDEVKSVTIVDNSVIKGKLKMVRNSPPSLPGMKNWWTPSGRDVESGRNCRPSLPCSATSSPPCCPWW